VPPNICSVFDDFLGSPDGSFEVKVPFSFAVMIFPGSSFVKETLPYLQVGVSSSEQGKGIGKVGLGFIGTQVVTPGNGFVMTHRPPWGWKGKGLLRRRDRLGERRDVGTPDPIDPDEAGKRVFALGGAIFILSITESGTSSPAVMGMSRGVAAEFLEPEGFFGKGEGSQGVDPDLEVSG